MSDPKVKWSICKNCKREKCEWFVEKGSDFDVFEDICYFEPNDYPQGDIGSATVDEMRKQNGDY